MQGAAARQAYHGSRPISWMCPYPNDCGSSISIVLGAYVATKIRGQRYTNAGQGFVAAFVAGLFFPASLVAKAKELKKTGR